MLKTNETTIIKKMHQQFNPVFAQLKTEVQTYIPDYDIDNLTKAYEFGLKAHRHQRRYSGEPYFEHCINVGLILAGMRMDTTTIISGLLHDVVEDTEVTAEELEEEFGETVSMLVNGVTKISGLKFLSKETRQAETFRKMLLSMADDIRVIIIKFADRLHNMRTLEHVPEKKRPRIALETRDVYAPLAHRLGIARIKDELEDLAFKHLDKKTYDEILKKITLSEDERHAYIESVAQPVIKELKKNNIEAEIYGRPKTYSSIYNKMQRRQRPFEEIYDLMAIRIIVDKLEECYYALGIVHSLFMPVYD
ncbi:MAG TPA: bifunctional (p)ppGpp synthetase/guanosine-3',5'-bis(diphosphate) 3'-pyrophosphohydrolase, partial [Caldithrix sp.]|nr:bifunctional (p)ppGpp synthetase/guanosine-3',5'-bis(diphosphate) 3'-pyrophosphohydrolase [Caldithrix sp.]